jgi:D-alanine-D-alanine ligase
MRKIRVGILFGGKSSEHEISLLSAKSVVEALDKEKYEPVLINIDRNGVWHLKAEIEDLSGESSVAIVPKKEGSDLIHLSSPTQTASSVEVVFPILHGTFGEDGTVQGLLKLAGIPFVGAGVLGSAIGMDKDVAKRLLRDAGIEIARFLVIHQHRKNSTSYEECVEKLGLPFFIKPANAGSSVGVAKVKTKEDFESALEEAFLYDRKVLVEEFIKGREIECSVLGNERPIASLPGEVIPQHEFYSYESKYLDEKGALYQIPVALPSDLTQKVQQTAIRAFEVLCCDGMARVDFFLTEEGKVILNEINTIPGFTKISMYPKLWQASGLSYTELIDRLICLAMDRHEAELSLATAYRKLNG